MPAKLASHMEEHGCLPVLYLSAWLLTAYASAFPLTFAARVVDVMLTDSYAEPMMKARVVCGHRRTVKSAASFPHGSKCVCCQNEGLPRIISAHGEHLSCFAWTLEDRQAPLVVCCCRGGSPGPNAWVQVALGIIKAAEKHLLAMDDMEEMVEFMKTDVPNWDMQRLQARAQGCITICIKHSALWQTWSLADSACVLC